MTTLVVPLLQFTAGPPAAAPQLPPAPPAQLRPLPSRARQVQNIFLSSKMFKIFSDCRGVQHLRPGGRSRPAALQSLQPWLGLSLLAEGRPPPHCTYLGGDGLYLQ